MRAFQIYGYTDTGAVRKINEDHILIGRFIKNHGGLGLYLNHNDDFLINYGMLFAVADGIGGENAGEIASKLALNAFERQFYGIEKGGQVDDIFINTISASAKRANETILQVASTKPELSGMGCTISGICITPTGYLIFNAGDSRVYRYRSGTLMSLTDDDTVTNLAVQLGQMSYQEAEVSKARHTITNSLGSQSFQLRIEKGRELRDNDIILICSDGLHDMIDHEQLEKLIDGNATVENIAKCLVHQAIQNGGHDNISVIVIRSDVFEEEIGWRIPHEAIPQEENIAETSLSDIVANAVVSENQIEILNATITEHTKDKMESE